ncbi:MAG: hypothetical protein AAFS07_05325 [Pseudomonadota bacterium]
MSARSTAAGAPSRGFVARVLGAWWDLRGTMRGVLDTAPSEGRLLSFAMIAGALLFAILALELTVHATRDPAVDRQQLSAQFFMGFIAYFLVMPLVLYALAAIVGLCARFAGGIGDHRENRAAVLWAWVISAPVFAVLALPGIFASIPPQLDLGLELVGLSFFVVALAYCIAEVQAFERVWKVFAVLASVTAFLWGSVLLLIA